MRAPGGPQEGPRRAPGGRIEAHWGPKFFSPFLFLFLFFHIFFAYSDLLEPPFYPSGPPFGLGPRQKLMG